MGRILLEDGTGSLLLEDNGIIDSYPKSNADTYTTLTSSGISGVGQTITGNGQVLSSVQFLLKRTGSPTSSLVAYISPLTGVAGVSGVPTGGPLATSSSVSEAIVTDEGEFVTFSFTGVNKITLTSGVNYGVWVPSYGNGVSNISIGVDSSSPSHNGNGFAFDESLTMWVATTSDTIFFVRPENTTDYYITEDTTPLVATLTDDFNDNSTTNPLWTLETDTGTPTETNGQLSITPLGAGFGYSGYRSVDKYTLTGSAIYVEVPQAANNVTGAETQFALNIDTNNEISFVKGGGSLIPRYRIAGTNNDQYPNYDATAHRWWRISESAGILYFDVSANGTTWTNLRTQAHTFTATQLENCNVWLRAGQYQALSPTNAGGTTLYDNLNVAPAAAPGTLSFTPDNLSLATTTNQPAIAVTNSFTPDNVMVASLTSEPAVTQTASVTPDNLAVATTSNEPAIALTISFTPASLQVATLTDSPTIVQTHAFTPDALLVASSSSEPTVSQTLTFAPYSMAVATYNEPTTASIDAVILAFNPDNMTVASLVGDGSFNQVLTFAPDSLSSATIANEPTVGVTVTLVPDDMLLATDIDEPSFSRTQDFLPDNLTLNFSVSEPQVFDPNLIAPSKIVVNLTNGKLLYKVTDKYVISL